jgi:hypothetical protein
MKAGISASYLKVVRGEQSAEAFTKDLKGEINGRLGISPSRYGHRREAAEAERAASRENA